MALIAENNMTTERYIELKAEIARLQGVDKRRSERVEERWLAKDKCTLPGCCNKDKQYV